MAGCGYVCPQCEGRGFVENGESCDWCSATKEITIEKPENEGSFGD